jgi:Tetratricopeptide repeat
LAYNNLGTDFVLQGNHREAVVQCEKAIPLNPRYADPYCNLGVLWEEKGETDQARVAWQHYARRMGSGSNACAQLARSRLGLLGESNRDDHRTEAERVPVPVRPGQLLPVLAKADRDVVLFRVCAGQDVGSCPPVRALVCDHSGLTGLVAGHVIGQVVFSNPSTQTTAKGIGIGQAEDEVRERYRESARAEEMPSGRYLIYASRRLAFAMRDDRVVSWFMF